MLVFLRRGTPIRYLQCFACRLQSTASVPEVETKLETEHKVRRFAKPLTSTKPKPFKGDFIKNIFFGEVDKSIFEYPPVISKDNFESLLKHSVTVEKHLQGNQISEITSDVLKDVRNVELFGLSIPQKYGGLGYNVTETMFIHECVGINNKLGRFLSHNECVGIKIINEYGSEEQKEKYLPRLADGKSIISFAALEDGPLIDISSYNTNSVFMEREQSYVINGKKKWVPFANIADLILVLATGSSLNEKNTKVRHDLFIVDKNTPGIKLHRLKSNAANEFDLYEIDFNDVKVPKSCHFEIEDSAFKILKYGLTNSKLSDAALISNLIKRLGFEATMHCSEKKLGGKPFHEHSYVATNLAFLSIYAYILESVIYLVSARCDIHNSPDLFMESCAAKILAVDLLQLSIEKYLQTLGVDCYKLPGILEEALKLKQHYSVLNENTVHLKLMIGSEGVTCSSKSLIKKIAKLRKPFDNPLDALKWNMFSQNQTVKNIKKKLNLKLTEEVHVSLKQQTELLELAISKLLSVIESHLVLYGNKALLEDDALIKFGEMATYIYALTACISRASTSYCNHVNNSENEVNMSHIIGHFISYQFEEMYNTLIYFNDNPEMFKIIGQCTFNNKSYPADHPLMRAY